MLRVAPDPYVRFDTYDYCLDPDLVGQRVEIRVGDREITAVALDTGELACRHTAVVCQASDDHRRWSTPGRLKRRRDGDRAEAEPAVQTRSLAIYDALIA